MKVYGIETNGGGVLVDLTKKNMVSLIIPDI